MPLLEIEIGQNAAGRLGGRRRLRQVGLEPSDDLVHAPVSREDPVELVFLERLQPVSPGQEDLRERAGRDQVAGIEDEDPGEEGGRVAGLTGLVVGAGQCDLRGDVVGVSLNPLLQGSDRLREPPGGPVLFGEPDEERGCRVLRDPPAQLPDAGLRRGVSHWATLRSRGPR